MTKALVKRRETRPAYNFDVDEFFTFGLSPFFRPLRLWREVFSREEEVWKAVLTTENGKATLTFDNFDKFDKDDIKVEYDGEYFTVKAEKEKKGISRRITNTYYLPDIDVDTDMEAEFEDGKVEITFPYEDAIEEEKVKTIDIK